MKRKTPDKINPSDIVQLTQNVGEYLTGQTFTRHDAEALGIDKAHLRDFVTDRAVKSGDSTTR
ncbi:MAG: hypothetical protein GC162_10840 [Planctomycetes bacterium]|nr:hypothetical protein [Planctomycetota bacterium]